MKFAKAFLVLVLCSNCSLIWSQKLKDYKWKNRVLVFVAANEQSKALQKNMDKFKKDSKALLERDLILLIATPLNVYDAKGDTLNIEPEAFYKQIAMAPKFEGVILIGKDGGVKLKKEFQVEPDFIFTAIDGMPMRQNEIQKQGN